MSFVKNYHEACEALYPYLREYLEEQGIDTSHGNFSCINPDHDDHNPSMGIAPSGKVAHCFSCGISLGIFQTAHILEKKPMIGQEFIQENLLYLAEKYGVEIETEPLTEEQIYKYDTYRAYRSAAELVCNQKSSKFFDRAIEQRGWSKDVCFEYGVGCIPDYKEFRETLKRIGFSASFLDDIDLGRKEIFGEDRLIFSIRDAKARPVGFASRNLGYTEDKKNGAKYVNQKGTGLKCNIYKKSTRLFGIDRVLEKRGKTATSIYVFEGYADVVTAAQSGIWNAVAVGSATFSLEQLSLLKEHNFYNIVLCFDGDKVGQERTAVMLDTVLAGHKDLRVSIVIIPEELDPAEFIQKYGPEKFKKLKQWSAFEWRLSQFAEDIEAEVICENMIPLIVNESSHITQEKMCTVLSKHTGVTLKTIQQELERLQNAKSNEKSRDRQAVLEKLVQAVHKTPDEAEYAIKEAESKLFDLAKQYNDDAFSEEACVAELDQQKNIEEAKDGSFSGFRLGSELASLEKALNGQWRKDVWLTFGGKANCFSIDTKFLDPYNGTYVTAEDLSRVNSVDLTKKTIRHEHVTNYIYSDKQECFLVKNSLGNEVETTAKHRYLTPNGWKRLEELEVGDKIAAPALLKTKNTNCFGNDKALFLGLMIGDGNFTQSRPMFCNNDPKILDTLKTTTNKIFGNNIGFPIYEEKDTYQMIGLTQQDWKTNRDSNGRCLPNPITSWFKQIGIYGQTAENKHIPEELFGGNITNTINVIRGLFSTDGSIYKFTNNNYSRYTIDFTSKSERLTKQVQHLLLRCGIVSQIRFKMNKCQTGNIWPSWYLSIRDRWGVVKFINQIGFLGKKDILAKKFLKEILENQKINNKYDNDIYWTTIKEITSVGIKKTCDITVDYTHNFCVDGFVLHNSGKTSFLSKLAYCIAKEPENDACVIYHSIDDTLEQVRPKFITIAEGSRQLTINAVADPNYHKRETPNINIDDRREEGYSLIKELMKNGRLILKDSNHGKSIAFADRLIKYYTHKYPGRNIVYILDNFHKLQDFHSSKGDERTRFKALSTIMKDLATSNHVCIITTVEYRKTQGNNRAGNQDVAETVQIEYDANLIAHVHNELHEKKQKAKIYHMETIDGEPINCPTIEIEIGKNKITSFKSSLWFDFFPHCSDFIYVSDHQILHRQEQNKGEEVDEKQSEIL